MRFSYIAYAEGGERRTGVVEAESEERAEDLLRRSNLSVVSVHRRAELPSLEQLFPTFFGVKSADVIAFSKGLASLLRSGIPLLVALRMLYAQTAKRSLREVIRGLITSLETGESFSAAVARHPTVFPSVYRRLIQIGEEIGSLDRVLDEVAGYMEKTNAAKARVSRALAYPSFVFLLGLGALALLITLVVPSLQRLFEEYGGQLPAITRFTMSLANAIQDNIFVIGLALLVVALIVGLYLRTPQGKRRRDMALLRLPPFKLVILNSVLARVSWTMALLQGAGVTTREALDLLIEIAENIPFQESLIAIRRRVLEGTMLSEALRQEALFPPLFTHMVGMGEASGTLGSNLQTLADTYEHELDSSLTNLTAVMEPALLLFVGSLVLFVAVSVMQPLYGVIREIR